MSLKDRGIKHILNHSKMKKEILKLGKTLSKVEQKQINGGINLTNFSCIGCVNLSGGGAPGGSPGHYSN